MKAPDSPSYSRSRLFHASVTCGAAIAGLTVVAFFLAWSWLGKVSGDAPPADSYLAICAVARVRLCVLLCCPLPKLPRSARQEDFKIYGCALHGGSSGPKICPSSGCAGSSCSVPICCPLRPFADLPSCRCRISPPTSGLGWITTTLWAFLASTCLTTIARLL